MTFMIKVAQLITELQKMPQDANVCVVGGYKQISVETSVWLAKSGDVLVVGGGAGVTGLDVPVGVESNMYCTELKT